MILQNRGQYPSNLLPCSFGQLWSLNQKSQFLTNYINLRLTPPLLVNRLTHGIKYLPTFALPLKKGLKLKTELDNDYSIEFKNTIWETHTIPGR